MNTPTHLLINWTLAGPAAQRLECKRYPRWAVLLGSVAPDLPLFALTFSGIAWFGWWKQWPAQEVGKHMFSNLFYQDPIWISLHNVMHSPTVCLMAIGLLFWRHGRAKFQTSWWGWFWLSCLVHTMVDIPVHHDDGPLIFWPFNWNYRFSSPVSYWDPDHFGTPMMVLEGALFLSLAARMIVLRWKKAKT